MSNEHKRADMRHLWQSQVVEGTSMSLDELRSALAKLDRAERVRVWVCGLFCLIFVGAVGVLLITAAAPIPIVRGGECVFALGAGFFFLQVILGLRQAPGKLLTQAEPQACAAFYRSVLERQRKFYRRSALWFPIFISASLLPILWMPPLRVMAILLWVLLVPFWVYTSKDVVRRSQSELDKLNAGLR
jgi:hypothetical protein